MRVAMFYQSVLSDWNNGNAHFLRGVATELIVRGHEVEILEPEDSWSFQNLVKAHGYGFVAGFKQAYPHLKALRYNINNLDLHRALEGVDVVLVHEWNSPALIKKIAEYKRTNRCCLLFHDTHHRSISDSGKVFRPELEYFDGVLAFGESVSERYRALGWGPRVWTWHEAADVRVFCPLPSDGIRGDLVWIGNWGDDERTAELREFLLEPARELGLAAEVYGVRYPPDALAELRTAGLQFRGWAPNYHVPRLFSRFRLTVHIPRRPYTEVLRGVPTIRVFEALACGIPLVSAPWEDSEALFTPGEDFLIASNCDEMKRALRSLLSDDEMAGEIARRGLRTILDRHTCGHRVNQLIRICLELGAVPEGVLQEHSKTFSAASAPQLAAEHGGA